VKIGLFPNTTVPVLPPDFFGNLARGAEDRGFHSLWLPEHIVMFDDLVSRAPFARSNNLQGGEYGLLDPLATLSFMAAVTRRIRLGTGVVLAPQHGPVWLAKIASTIDYLSQGRLDLGLGVGWVRQEFEALDVPFDQRGPLADTCIQILRTLWDDPISAFANDHYDLPPCRHWPKPIQEPSIPITIGGNSDAALRRVARHGQGWYAFNLDPDELRARLVTLDGFLADHTRSRADLTSHVCGFRKPVDADTVARYRDAGANQVILLAMDIDASNTEAKLDEYAESILEPATAL
jgi:probable F420-dependent oxidoreductase